MAFWLADKRMGQQASWIQRFDPRFWTVDFPRPMMAALTTPAADALRVDAVFYKTDELAGLIWESSDRWDHPLLAYETNRDYGRTTLRFRWRSSNLLPLDAVNGPTLTIEGRDASGAERTWYVRLWNYARGTPTDAEVVLPFSKLDGGFLLPAEADPVHPAAIDRLFISLVPTGYDPASSAALAQPIEAWLELSGMVCDGHRPLLSIGDVMVPPHGLCMATGYDDAYNQAPARLLRTIRGLGYRDSINHYVGMSHYMRLARSAAQDFIVDPAAPPLNRPTEAWHREFFTRAAASGYDIIASLSYELLAMHCPEAWQQRDHAGTPARTGWVPPSALLSPANTAAMTWLRGVAAALVALQLEAGLPVRFQVGEPWWWVTGEGRICLYDEAARAALGGEPPVIDDVRQPLTSLQKALLDQAGSLLAGSTAAIGTAVRSAAGEAGAELLLLAYLPSAADPVAPEVRRANLPTGWSSPAFDVLQLEDYDWVTQGAEARHRAGLAEAAARLGYPAQRQHYLSGFVLAAADREQWRAIDAAADDAIARGVAQCFVWALPQVCRDGYVRLPSGNNDEEDQTVQAFDDVLYPLALGREASVLPEFATQVAVTASGHERRNALWSDARLRFDVGPGIRSEADIGVLIAFFRARRGQARGFRLRDPSDYSSAGMTDPPQAADQRLGFGDGLTARFPLLKRYGEGPDAQLRRITRPRGETVRVSLDSVQQGSGWTLEDGGVIVFGTAPGPGVEVAAGFLFDVPVRFADDRLEINSGMAAAGEVPSVPLVELREAA